MRLQFYIAMLITVLAVACKHDNIEPSLGPDIEDNTVSCPSANFSIDTLMNSANAVDFSSETITITSNLNESADWEVVITGDNGAQYVESGTGNSVNVNWDGAFSNGILFRAGDSALVQLKVACLDTIDGQKIYITQGKTYSNIIVDDFDGNTSITGWSNASGDLVGLNITASDSGAAQADFYMYAEGVDVGKGSYLGMAQQQPTSIAYGLTTTSDQLYLNALIRGTSNSIAEFRLYESDGDYYYYRVPVTWSGWQLVSMNYDDFQTGSGGVDKVPSTIQQIRFTLRSDDPTPSAVVNIDYINFTEGGPMVP